MTEPTKPILEHGDIRRAATFYKHANPDAFDAEGVDAVLREAAEEGRGPHLLLATVALGYGFSERLATDLGQRRLNEIALTHYREETTDE
ncbi:hypothetical protein [Gordonia paraffinivorans]|uniref:hypothetical protein n=1 Tax=Gordonia paraffinivorans TaxID=175628 RepID=UPI0014469724|nr:hypothetical protein [Gordonia paraffinivorans]